MTIAVWPDDLPRPERSSWNLSPQDTRVKRDPDAGTPESRRRFSGKARFVSLSVLLSPDERAIFWNFYDETVADGSLPFRMPNPTMDGWALATGDGAPLLTGDGVPIALASIWLVKFGDGVPSEAIKGVRFRISFQVVVMP